MSSLVKALVILALVLPMTAYVVGSLVASGGKEPSDRDPVIIQDPPVMEPAAPRETRTPTPGDDEGARDDNEVRVVTPRPTQVGSDDGRLSEEDDDDSTSGDGSADDDGRDDRPDTGDDGDDDD